ncbi:UDP-N-acetylenolpyruvoylglucosamine reductase, partial [Dietzia sp. CW19]|nr:UDP-N-acetylenolpyruvoylglucosamine reductase [Dietzia sp. CW19]
ATADDVIALAREVRDGVFEAFGVELHPEPVWVGCSI